MGAECERLFEPIDILLVEPNSGDARLFTENFKEAKLTNEFHSVGNGDAALDFVHQRGEYDDAPRPDLVLLEPELPGTSGRDVLKTLRNEPALDGITVVVLTGSEAEEAIARSQGIKADHYVQKPVDPDDFIDFVDEIENFWLTIVQTADD